jgi:hypothetical protein
VGREWGGCGAGAGRRWQGETAGDMSERAVGVKWRQQGVGILYGKAKGHGTKCCGEGNEKIRRGGTVCTYQLPVDCAVCTDDLGKI